MRCAIQVRELVYDFYWSRYAACLARLQRLLPLLRMDMYLSAHVDTLYAAVSLFKHPIAIACKSSS